MLIIFGGQFWFSGSSWSFRDWGEPGAGGGSIPGSVVIGRSGRIRELVGFWDSDWIRCRSGGWGLGRQGPGSAEYLRQEGGWLRAGRDRVTAKGAG